MDLGIGVLLLLILLGAAPMLSLDFERSSVVFGWILCIPIIGILLLGTGILACAIFKHIERRCLFGVFLCHHKGGAGSLCRLLKILIARHSPTRVFLDCDQLEKLDLLFDIVRTCTKSVVVVLTPEVLKRVWCAGCEFWRCLSLSLLILKLLANREESLAVTSFQSQ